MPEDAPVTIAILPFKFSFFIAPLQNQHRRFACAEILFLKVTQFKQKPFNNAQGDIYIPSALCILKFAFALTLYSSASATLNKSFNLCYGNKVVVTKDSVLQAGCSNGKFDNIL